MGVTLLFKLNAGDEVAVHAATPITMEVKAMINAEYNGILRGGADDFMALQWDSVSEAHFHYS